MLSKAHLTSHYRMSGSVSDHTIVIIWVVKIFFVQFFCIFLPPLLSTFCFCSVHTTSALYCAPLCMKCSLGISNFLEEIYSLSYLLFSSISLHWSLRKSFLSLLAILWNSAFKWEYLSLSSLIFTYLLFTAMCRASETTILPYCICFWGDSLDPCLLINISNLCP